MLGSRNTTREDGPEWNTDSGHAGQAQACSLPLEPGAALADNLLRLSNRMLEQLPSQNDEGSLGQQAQVEVEAFGQEVKQHGESAKAVVVKRGSHGEGKSTSINLALEEQEFVDDEYGLKRLGLEPCATDAELRRVMLDRLEGARELRKRLVRQGCDKAIIDDVLQNALRFVEQAQEDEMGHYIPETDRVAEESHMRAVKEAYKHNKPPKGFRGFLLKKSPGRGRDTTKILVQVKQGTFYHILVVYKTEDEIRDELWNYDWEQLRDLDKEKDDADVQHAKFKRAMLLRVAGLPEDTPDSALPIPSSKADVRLAPDIMVKLNKGSELISGRGRVKLDDRLFIREELDALSSNADLVCLAHALTVFVPSHVLREITYVDNPGSGVRSPMALAATEEATRMANVVELWVQRTLQENQPLLDDLEASGVIDRLVDEPWSFKVFVFSALEESTEFNLLESLDVAELEHDKATTVDANRRELRRRIEACVARRDLDPDGPSADVLVQRAYAAVEHQIFAGYPMLYTSLKLSHAELRSDPQQDQDKLSRVLEALSGFPQLIASLKSSQSHLRQELLCQSAIGFSQRLQKLVAPSSSLQLPRVSLRPEMVEIARAEACKAWKGREREKQGEAENLLGQLDEVWRGLKREVYEDGFLSEVEESMAKMMDKVDPVRINQRLDEQLGRTATSRRSLQNAFDTRLAGSYRKVQLYRLLFADFQFPSAESLEPAVYKLIFELVSRVKQLMKDIMCRVLGCKAEDEEARRAIIQAVDETIPLDEGHDQPSRAKMASILMPIREAVVPLDRCLSKNCALSHGTLHETCRQKLCSTLLSKIDPTMLRLQDYRTVEGKAAFDKARKEVLKKASRVTSNAENGIRKLVVDTVERAMQAVKKRLNTRYTDRPPVFFKIYRAVFTQLLRVCGERAATPQREDTVASAVRGLVDEAREAIGILLECEKRQDGGAGSAERSAKLRLDRFVEQKFQMPKAIKAPLLKPSRTDTPSDTEQARLLKLMRSPPAASAVKGLPNGLAELHRLLDRRGLELGRAAGDGNCLFHSLLQVITDDRAEYQPQHLDLRRCLVELVRLRYATVRQEAVFSNREQAGRSLQEWAAAMEQDGEWGDEHCIEEFALKYNVRVLLLTPYACDAPIPFPRFHKLCHHFEQCIHIAHVPSGSSLVPNHYVPVWPRAAGGCASKRALPFGEDSQVDSSKRTRQAGA